MDVHVLTPRGAELVVQLVDGRVIVSAVPGNGSQLTESRTAKSAEAISSDFFGFSANC